MRFCHLLNANERILGEHRYLLYVLQQIPAETLGHVPQVRRATLDDLKSVAGAHAQSLLDEGHDALLETERAAFVDRCATRIQRGQTWIWKEGEKLIAKADVVTDTHEVAYMEAVWVTRDERRKGYGWRFISRVTNSLMERTSAICVLAKQENAKARLLYEKIGFRSTENYRAIFI